MKKLLGFLSALLLLSLASAPGCGGGGTSDGDNNGGRYSAQSSDVGGVFTGDATLGAMMVDENGEMLTAMTENDANGDVADITGVVWSDANGGSVTVYLDAEGLPTKTVMGDYILLFSNWNIDAGTVDIALIYTPTEYVEIFKGVSVDTSDYSILLSMSSSSFEIKSFCFPGCESDLQNLSQLMKVAALGISVGACGVATTVSLGAMAIPCLGVVVSTATVMVDDEWWLDNLEITGNILALDDVIGCVEANPAACITLALDATSRIVEAADADIQSNSSLISTGEIFVTDPGTPSGVVSEGGGLPSCSGTYECTPNAYMPCYPDGVKQCSASCEWGSCSDPCGDGLCDSAAGETYTSCPGDCPSVCGDGFCNATAGETSSCPGDCNVSSCCQSTGNCPSETATTCPGSCCCCGYGERCSSISVCSWN